MTHAEPVETPRPARYVVTGCAGFIGSHLVDVLLEAGHEVVGIDSFTDYYPRSIKEANLVAARRHDAFKLVEQDLAEASLPSLLEAAHGIFHLAARPGVRASWGDPFAQYLRDNVLATQRVFEAAAAAGVRVVFASSSSIYGNAVTYPISEQARPGAISPYGVSKLACEHLAFADRECLGLDAVILRYFTVYGPRQRPDMAFSRILSALMNGTPFCLSGDGKQSRDFTFVGDAVAATLSAMNSAPAGAIYNVGGGAEATLREVIRICENLTERRLEIVYEPSAVGDVRRTVADTRHIQEELGWHPRTPLGEGLAAQLSGSVDAAALRADLVCEARRLSGKQGHTVVRTD